MGKGGAERTARRILSLWLPRLPTDAHSRRHPERRDHPLAAILAERGRLGVAAVNRAAAEAGVHPGMSLADARAIEPALAVFDAEPESDAHLLERIAGWCTRYTPWTTPDGPDGVALDITGCAHLFGGEEAVAADLSARLTAAGFESRISVADTPAAAWALARFGGGGKALPDLSPLPVAALRLPAATVDGLAAVGLRRIGDLHALPRATLAARFGPELLRRLDQAYGRLDEPLSPRLPVPPHSVRLALPEPITTAEAIAEALRRLLTALCAGLENTGEGARRLRLELHRVDRRLEDAPQTLVIGTGHPVRRPDALMRLFAQKLDRVEPGPGLELMVLSATEAGPLAAAQAALDGTTDGGMDGQPELGELMDRLGNRLGERAVLRLVPRQSWLPERSVAPASAFSEASGGALWPTDRPRPVRLLAPPEPIEAMALVPDDPPVMFLWRGVQHRIRRADGPERIEAEWWRRDGEPRDYYRVEDEAGRRFWVYRQGLYRPGVAALWFLHGFFG
ncbi:DNA polymerase [Azospirillum argentinense]|uniref:DNA-directed DNA polymerase n=1 Tax=Azospirillum argentinense TaxID=2970906 RepID=A0A060DIF0_9PROT|nr:DNA polymerase Y family protein [Azospirillum argentinense]AIB10783.1 DNA polymerase [Azospirillum argentinense]